MEVGRREAERITGYEAGRYAESATERNAEVRKVSTKAGALDKDFDCGRLSVAAAAAVLDVLIDPTTDHTDAKVTSRETGELAQREVREPV